MAMLAVGAGVAVSAALTDYPVFGAQAVRYAAASVLLGVVALALRRTIPLPRRSEWPWLVGVALTGLVLFNIAVIRSVEHAEPAATAVIIGAVPLGSAVQSGAERHRVEHRRCGPAWRRGGGRD